MLFGQPDKSFYLNEIVRYADMGRGAISRELNKLTDAGLLIMQKQGNQNHYQANKASPIASELIAIVKKTFGVVAIMQNALTPILGQLEQAFIYGSIAKGTEHADSDVDVMLVGENLSYSDILQLLEPAEEQLQRTINPTIYTAKEFAARIAEGQNFLTKVLAQARLDLLKD
ncbi:transcriptional regulator [Aliidiomarina taiwanensis]|uniref:Transcriptional regulator n=2 Tax=Aliidiomarina taiwanensis TaxID=946228 RepID=A0A432X2A6_9GAMM|nr:transcriptional regulator [Aliidiomarina taiwanensis]